LRLGSRRLRSLKGEFEVDDEFEHEDD